MLQILDLLSVSLRVKVRVSWCFAKPSAFCFPPALTSPPVLSLEWNALRPASLPSWLILEPSRHIPPEIFVQGVQLCLCSSRPSGLHWTTVSAVTPPLLTAADYTLCPSWNALCFHFFVASKLLYDLFTYYFWWLYLSLLDNQLHVAKYFNVCSFMCFKCLIHGMWSVKFFGIN